VAPRHRADAWGDSAGSIHDPQVGLHPVVTSQCSSTTLYQVSYHIQSLFFFSKAAIGCYPTLRRAEADWIQPTFRSGSPGKVR
jgi:hypothetical protein